MAQRACGDVAMDGAMQAPGRRIGRIGTGQRFGIVGVDQKQVAGLDAREMHLVRVHQEFRAVLVDGQREMVGDRLMHVQPRRPAEGGSEVDPLLVIRQVAQRSLCRRAGSWKFLRFKKNAVRGGRQQPITGGSGQAQLKLPGAPTATRRARR